MPDLLFSDAFNEGELANLTAINPADVRVAAMNLLARREHSRKELKQKLQKRFDDESVIDAQLNQLAEENLQSDSRYAESFVRQRFNRGYGPLRIRQEMRQKGLSDGEISVAMTAEDFDWCASAERVLSRKYGNGCAIELKEKARRTRFMQYRGFSADHFSNLV
ncbi:regulatory protein RecX [Pseudohalioglobus lutimaris]|nr:regulatory protein RecX [Pseudohalioglobus lutimaris]